MQIKVLNCVRSIFFGLLAASAAVAAGPPAAFSADGDYEVPSDFPNPQDRAEAITLNNIKRTYRQFNQFKKRHGEAIAKIPSERGQDRTLWGNRAPAAHPLDRFDGHLPNPVSWLEYVTDSVTILQRDTFSACLEPRVIVEKIGPKIIPVDPLNSAQYAAACMANCPSIDNPPPFNLTFIRQDWKVHSYYWPQYVVSVNKAGAQMIDPSMFGESYGKRLVRHQTQLTEKLGNETGEGELARYIREMGIDTGQFKDFSKRIPPGEAFLQDGGSDADDGIRFPGAMRPNAFWRAANARPRSLEGYAANPRCLFDAVDPPTSEKKIVSYRFDQGMFGLYARYPALRAIVDSIRFKTTTGVPGALAASYSSNMCASYRMQQLGSLYGGLAKVGISPGGSRKTHMDHCLPGGGEISGSLTANAYMPEMQADALRAVTGMMVFSSKPLLFALASQAQSGLSRVGMTDEKLRVNQFTFYKERHRKNRQRYFANGIAMQPAGPEYPIVFLDKMQRIFPRQPLAGADGAGGSGLDSIYADTDGGSAQAIAEFAKARGMITRGSHCFRPEDIPNWSGEDHFAREEFPNGLALDAFRHYGESRWAFYNRRIVCSCQLSGLEHGCRSLNHGDNAEDSFAGGPPLAKLPPPFADAIPKLDEFAVKIGGVE